MANLKTNAMRILDKAGIKYVLHSYDSKDGAIDGVSVAKKLGQNPACVYKTLVTKGVGGSNFVFVVPVEAELDLKAAARSVGEKSVSMIPVADINKTTGYIRGGCSPVGMKKAFVTVFDSSCAAHPKIFVSGGKIGLQMEIGPHDLIKITNAVTASITKAEC